VNPLPAGETDEAHEIRCRQTIRSRE